VCAVCGLLPLDLHMFGLSEQAFASRTYINRSSHPPSLPCMMIHHPRRSDLSSIGYSLTSKGLLPVTFLPLSRQGGACQSPTCFQDFGFTGLKWQYTFHWTGFSGKRIRHPRPRLVPAGQIDTFYLCSTTGFRRCSSLRNRQDYG
jgi:hypothetical protein